MEALHQKKTKVQTSSGTRNIGTDPYDISRRKIKETLCQKRLKRCVKNFRRRPCSSCTRRTCA